MTTSDPISELFERACEQPAADGAQSSPEEKDDRAVAKQAGEAAYPSPSDEHQCPRIQERIGPYRILKDLGSGGTGTVYLAVRSDNTFRKLVAVKVVRPDHMTPEELRRFQQERQVLAGLDHPNIAHILDGGTAPDGRPYFVMDYVDGLPIDVYANRKRLTVRERVRLIQQVCAAVDYVHNRGIVHRDLKPANILVTADAIVKLLDFSIAKVQIPGEPGQTIASTGGPLMLMTPSYASPEQLRGEAATRASDIYCIGVLLYELLTGKRPHVDDGTGMRKLKATLARETPPRPSANVSEDVIRTPESNDQLRRQLVGRLDAIALRALSNEPDARYTTAQALCSDLQKFLDCPRVVARNQNLAARVSTCVRRTGIALTGATLMIVFGGGSYQAIQAHIERRRADTKEAKLQQLVGMLSLRLNNSSGDERAELQRVSDQEKINDIQHLRESFERDFRDILSIKPGMTPARRQLIDRTVTYLNGVAGVGANSRQVQRELAGMWQIVAELQSSRLEPNFGDEAGAGVSYRHVLSILRSDPEIESDSKLKAQLSSVEQCLKELGARVSDTAVEPPPSLTKQRDKATRSAVLSTTAPGRRVASLPAQHAAAPAEPAIAVHVSEIDNDLREHLESVAVRVKAAQLIAEPVRTNLESRNMSLDSTVTRNLAGMQIALDAAESAAARGESETLKRNLQKAEYLAAQVLRYFGQ